MAEKKQLGKEVKQMQYNVDFRLLDLDEDIQRMRKQEQVDPDRDEAVFEELEKRMAKKKGTIVNNKAETFTVGDMGIVGLTSPRWTRKRVGRTSRSSRLKSSRQSQRIVGEDDFRGHQERTGPRTPKQLDGLAVRQPRPRIVGRVQKKLREVRDCRDSRPIGLRA